MNNKDLIQRFIFENNNVRGEIVRVSESYLTIVNQHHYPPSLRRLMGEFLVVTALLSAIIKFKGRLTVQFQGPDPLKLVIVQSNNQFEVRGLAQWKELSEQDLISTLKRGVLAIIISPDTSTTRYQGVVAWQGNSLAQSIEGYFRDSEQLPTRLWLAVNETTAAGMLLQPLPREGSKKSSPVLGDNDWEHIVHLTDTIKPEELLTLDNHTILHRLYSQEAVQVFEPAKVSFRCTCSVERGENAIRMLGEKEAEDELNKKQRIAVICEFCNKEYLFDRVDVMRIFKENDSSGSAQLH